MSEEEIRQIYNAAQQALRGKGQKEDKQQPSSASATEKVAQKHHEDQRSEDRKKEKDDDPVDHVDTVDQHSDEKKEKNMIKDSTDIMEFFNNERDIQESRDKRTFVCHICRQKKDSKVKWAFSMFNALVMHSRNWHGHEDNDVDQDLYYHCTAFNCYEVFKNYEEQLDHRLSHDELYCRFCCKFVTTRLRTGEHERVCPENEEGYRQDEPPKKKSKGKKAAASKQKPGK